MVFILNKKAVNRMYTGNLAISLTMGNFLFMDSVNPPFILSGKRTTRGL
jgi:hypothetical protein